MSDLLEIPEGTCTTHPGHHTRPNLCIECGRFSAHSWATEPYWGMDGLYVRWGGTCKVHGPWSESS